MATQSNSSKLQERIQLWWEDIPQVQAIILRDPDTLEMIGYSDAQHITLANDYTKDTIVVDISDGVTSQQRVVELRK